MSRRGDHDRGRFPRLDPLEGRELLAAAAFWGPAPVVAVPVAIGTPDATAAPVAISAGAGARWGVATVVAVPSAFAPSWQGQEAVPWRAFAPQFEGTTFGDAGTKLVAIAKGSLTANDGNPTGPGPAFTITSFQILNVPGMGRPSPPPGWASGFATVLVGRSDAPPGAPNGAHDGEVSTDSVPTSPGEQGDGSGASSGFASVLNMAAAPTMLAMAHHDAAAAEFTGPAVIQNLFLNVLATNATATLATVPRPGPLARSIDATARLGDLPVAVAEAAASERLSAFASPVEVLRGNAPTSPGLGREAPAPRADLGPGAAVEADGDPTAPAVAAVSATVEARSPAPMVADLIADALPLDRDLVVAALDRFLEPLGDLGNDLDVAESPVTLTTEVLAVAGAIGGLELARRHLRRGRSRWDAGVDGRSGSLSSPEWPGAWSASRP